MSISNWGKNAQPYTQKYIETHLEPIIKKILEANPSLTGNITHSDTTLTGNIIQSDTTFNNIIVYGKLNVYNYYDHFVAVNDVEYSFCQENNVTFTENTEIINLPGTMSIDDGRTIHINNMTQNTININSFYKIYHWILTPPEGLNAVEITPNMMYKFVFTRNPVTTEGKWSIMC